jgi:hypothetical protein
MLERATYEHRLYYLAMRMCELAMMQTSANTEV